MTRLFFVTQQLDARHPTLGAAASMVRALAERVDEVVVFASLAAPDLPPNVRFRSFAASTQALRGFRFEAALALELARGRPVAVLAHMSPIYAMLAAPLARPLRVPLLLWFTQQHARPTLARAERVVDAILSVDARSVPISSAKVHAIGHGIDVQSFARAEDSPTGTLRLLSLGRYAQVKGHDVALRALRRLLDDGVDATMTIRGEEATPHGATVRAGLRRLAAELELGGHTRLLDPVPRSDVPALLRETDVLVNATRGAAADKVVFEALGSCVPVVASSPVFDTLLPDELRFSDVDELAAAIRAAAALPSEQRRALRARVAAEHSVDHWADAVLASAGRLAR